MLASKHDCYAILHELKNKGEDVSEELNQIIHEDITPRKVVAELKRRDTNEVRFYLNLNNKAHKIIKEILTCDGKPVSTYIKIATSLITQGVITMEHLFSEDVDGQNYFIECLGLKQLSEGISIYFNTGDYTQLVEAVKSNQKDVRSLLDD